MSNTIQTELHQALQSQPEYWTDENQTTLNQTKLIDAAEKTDPIIIGLLLKNETLKRHFFVEIGRSSSLKRV